MQTVAEILTQSNDIRDLDDATYCEHCMVIAIDVGAKYCADCAQDVTDYLHTIYA